jgi:hypothetical protein
VRAIRSGNKELERVYHPLSSLATWAAVLVTWAAVPGKAGTLLTALPCPPPPVATCRCSKIVLLRAIHSCNNVL